MFLASQSGASRPLLDVGISAIIAGARTAGRQRPALYAAQAAACEMHAAA
jgi:hypothetical protein